MLSRLAQVLSVVTVCGSPLIGQTLVKDFNTAPDTTVLSSGAQPVATLPGGDALLVAYRPGTGRELWRSDGTAAGTRLLADVNTGYQHSSPTQFVTLPSGLILFTAGTFEHGWELWRTDGTTAGTRLVKDIRPGPEGSVAVNLAVVGNEVVFFANDGTHGIEPWKSDGTAAGTVMIADINPNPNVGMSNGTASLAPLGNNAFVFTALAPSFQQWQLWRSDLTTAGTVKIVDLPPNNIIFRPGRLASFGNRVLFEARTSAGIDEAWITDGTVAGTLALGAAISGDFQVAGSNAFFSGGDLEPWVTDGTVAGTRRVVTLSGVPFLAARPAFLGAIGNRAVFTAGYGGPDRNLYVSDGTVSGTVSIGVASTYSYYSANRASVIGGDLWFQAADDNNVEGIWRTDGTAAGTSMVATVRGDSFLATQGTILFRGIDPTSDSELWQTDGTTAGTRLLVDIARQSRTLDSDVFLLTTFRDRVVLSATDNSGYRQLWTTDGTGAGTRPITALSYGTTGLSALSNDEFLFLSIAHPGSTPDPWVSDGTLGGLRRLTVSASHPGFRVGQGVAMGRNIVFNAFTNALGAEPWISDGTLAGTRPIADIVPGTGSSQPAYLHAWQDRAFFLGTTSASGGEPWVTDGTAAGTFQLTETFAGADGIYSVFWAEAGDLLFFTAGAPFGADVELWVTNGTRAGTHRIEIAPGSQGSHPNNMTAVGDRLVFGATVGGEQQLFSSDGTQAGTQILPVTEVHLIRRIDDDTALVIAGDRNALVAWTTDGTTAGTQMVGPMPVFWIHPNLPSNPTDDKLLVELDDPVVGRELFVTDGTLAGTRLIADVSPEHARPSTALRAGTRIVFTADDGVHGRELHAFDVTAMQDEVVDTFGFGCSGSSGHVPRIDLDGEADASGSGFDVVVDDTLALTPVLLAVSTEPTAVRVSGCTLWTGGTILTTAAATDGLGTARFSLVPVPALLGHRFVAQAFPIDPNGRLLGIASATPGLEFVLGP